MDDFERAAGLLGEPEGLEAEGHSLLSALGDRSPLVRHVAAIRLAEHSPRSLPEQSIRELVDTLDRLERRESLGVADDYSELMGDENDLGQDIALALAKLAPGQADFAIPVLLEHWDSDPSFYELAFALLALAIPAGTSPFAPGSFAGAQRRVLEALLRNGPVWSACAGFGESLAARGLPDTRDGMLDFLASI